MSHGEYRDRKKSYKEQRHTHKPQSKVDRWWYRFDREQEQLEARQALANPQSRALRNDGQSRGLDHQ